MYVPRFRVCCVVSASHDCACEHRAHIQMARMLQRTLKEIWRASTTTLMAMAGVRRWRAGDNGGGEISFRSRRSDRVKCLFAQKSRTPTESRTRPVVFVGGHNNVVAIVAVVVLLVGANRSLHGEKCINMFHTSRTHVRCVDINRDAHEHVCVINSRALAFEVAAQCCRCSQSCFAS